MFSKQGEFGRINKLLS